MSVTPFDLVTEEIHSQLSDPNCDVPVLFVTGEAGSGKTFLFRNIIIPRVPDFAVLAATTGIAGVNLGTTTINSLLKYFDTASLEDAFVSGWLMTRLHKIAHQVKNIVIDETSMQPAKQLSMIYEAARRVNNFEAMKDRNRKLGIILTGDFMQLPPVKEEWAFESDVWKHFAEHVIRLNTNYRQGNPDFLRALNFLRSGNGPAATEILKDIINWKVAVDRKFDGTTIVAKNEEVDRHNWLALNDLPGELIRIPSTAWGNLKDPDKRRKGEWKNIPEILEIKKGAYVMILSNSQSDGEEDTLFSNLEYANGDCGYVKDVDVQGRQVIVELVRNKSIVGVPLITRYLTTKEDNSPLLFDGHDPIWNAKKKHWELGSLTYMPLRLAYAATVHKTQGLTLDRIQVDSRAHFFGSPAMAYVSLSRAREPQNVYIVGSPRLFENKVKVDPKVLPWL